MSKGKGSGEAWWWVGAAALAVVVWGGGKVAGVYAATAETAHPELEALRTPIAKNVMLVFWDYDTPTQIAVAQLLMAQAWIESRGKASAVGDAGFSVGPSIGPLQVSRGTAIDLGLWTPPDDATPDEERAAYRAKVTDTDWCVWAGAKVWRAKLSAAGGDLFDAVRRYNGGGALAAAYQDKALGVAEALYPGTT